MSSSDMYQTFDDFGEYLECVIHNLKNEKVLPIETVNSLAENDYSDFIIDYYEEENMEVPDYMALMIYESKCNKCIVYYYTDINHTPSNEFLSLVAKNNLEDFFLIVHRTRKDISFDINSVPGIKLDRRVNIYDAFYCLIKYCEDKNLPLPPKLIENTETRILVKLIKKLGYSMFRETKVLQYIIASKFFTSLENVDLDTIRLFIEIVGRVKSHQLISLFEDETYFNIISDIIYQVYPRD